MKILSVILFVYILQSLSSWNLFGQDRSQIQNLNENIRSLKTTRGGKVLAPVIDIFPQIASGFYTQDRIANEIKLFKEMGFERIYLVVCNPGYPSFSYPYLAVMPPGNSTGNTAFENIVRLGDPNLAYLHEAKKQGMEAWAVYKPYEGGSGQTIPHHTKAPSSLSQFETIGGEYVYFDNLLSQRPDLRVKRKPTPAAVAMRKEEPIRRFEIAFKVDELKDRVGRNSFLNFEGIPDSKIKRPEIAVWVSKDNGKYVRYNNNVRVTSKVEKRMGTDANSFFVEDKSSRYLVIDVNFEMGGDNFKNEGYDYFALTIDDHGQGLYTIPHSMIKAFTSFGEVPLTAAIYARSPAIRGEDLSIQDREWGKEGYHLVGKAAVESFKEMGFEFEWHGAGHWGNGWSNSPVYGIAIGKREYMKGTPCEAYEEVRSYWLDNIQRWLMMGFDGVDIRLQNHSGMVADYANYGYNEPIIARYKQKYGIDILTANADPLKIMEIRGDFFMDFLEKASRLAHRLNKKLQIHLKRAYINPVLGDDWHDIAAWHMPKVVLDWKRAIDLADEVTIKDYYFNKYEADLGREIKEYANKQKKRVWIHAYLGQGAELNDKYFSLVDEDSTVGGILLYEANGTFLKTSGMTSSFNAFNVRKMLSIMKEVEFVK